MAEQALTAPPASTVMTGATFWGVKLVVSDAHKGGKAA